MPTLKEPDRITLAEGLTLLEMHLATEEAKARLRQAFVRKAFDQAPLFAFEYGDADIDWTTGSVKIPRKKDRFVPTFSRSDFNRYFFQERVAPPSYSQQTVISADMCKALGAQPSDENILSGRAAFEKLVNGVQAQEVRRDVGGRHATCV